MQKQPAFLIRNWVLVLLLLTPLPTLLAQMHPLGVFDHHEDIGNPIGYIYGEQGSINVPSWSPDSKKIAFVSNSKL